MERATNKTARIILEIDNKLVFIKRIKKDKNNEGKLIEYYTTAGGHLELGENFEEAAIREAYEELGIEVKLDRLFTQMYNEDIGKEEKYYIASYLSGELGTGKGEEFGERAKDFDKYGSYEIVLIDKNDLEKYNIFPKQLKVKLIEKY